MDVIATGAGPDGIDVRDGRSDRVSCDPGSDTVKADRLDRRTGCETVNRSAPARWPAAAHSSLHGYGDG